MNIKSVKFLEVINPLTYFKWLFGVLKNILRKISAKLKLKRRIIATIAAMHLLVDYSKLMKIIGVTGTNGKTTTATILYKIATELGYKAGLIGTVENIIVDEIKPSSLTTPDPLKLNELFKEMAEKGCEYVFMEVSSHALDQGRVNGITFAGAIFTNLTHDHLDYHKNINSYFKAKKKLFSMLPKEAFALSNADDEYGRKILSSTKARKFYYGFNELRDFRGQIKKIDSSGLKLEFRFMNHEASSIKSKLLGKFNAYNLLAIWSACLLLEFDMKKVNKILEYIEPPRGRFEYLTSPNKALIIIDYAHTPDALEKVLLTINEIKPEKSKIISVFGCGGDRDRSKRSIMGLIGASLSDVAIFTSDNPRNEQPEDILLEMTTALTKEVSEKVKVIVDRREAIRESLRLCSPGDIILCAGKGHEDYQEIKCQKYHFSDKEEFEKLF